jgi:uncharacterized zinc-type alcohol dehydrogenase-like protein
MALKFAKAFGAEVTLFTRTAGKEDEARRLGADHVVLSTDPAQMAAVAGRFHFILDTVPNAHDLAPYICSLGFNGVLILLGLIAPIEPTFSSALLLMGRKAVTSSNVGSIIETQEMLDFCATRGITCDVEMIKIQDINAAFERLKRGDVRYRFVIDIASLRKAETLA